MTLSSGHNGLTIDGVEAAAAGRGIRLGLGLVLAGYLVVTLLYGSVNPLFEAPDEHWHYFTAQYIAENGRLPFVAAGNDYDEWLGQEAAQPPLYYLLGGLLIAPFDTSAARQSVWINPYRTIGDASDPMNLNYFVHTEDEAWPWQGHVLAAHLLRIFSTLLGLGTLVCIYLAGRLLWPEDAYRALLAAALVAFLPQYNFLHASVSNDSLVIFLVSAALWQLVRLWQTGVTRWRLLLLGITIGLSALAKNVGITLLIYAEFFLALMVLQDIAAPAPAAEPDSQPDLRGWRLGVATLLLVVLPALATAGWLWARNWLLYGDVTAANQFIRIAGGDRGYTLWQALAEWRGLWFSSLAVFGWFNLRAPNWVYWFWNGLIVVAAAGLLVRLITWLRRDHGSAASADAGESAWRRAGGVLNQDWFLPLLLALWVLAVYASLLLFMMRTEAAQGRLLFPALLPLSLGVASGLTAVTWLRALSPLFPVAALATTLTCLFTVIPPAYEKPALLTALPQGIQTVDVELAPGMRLLGVGEMPPPVIPGETAWLDLYWQGDGSQEGEGAFVLSAFGRDRAEIGKVHSYHGRGLYPAALWPAGAIVADRVGFRIDDEAQAPVLAEIDVSMDGGRTRSAGAIKIVPPAWPAPVEEVLASLGPAIDLAGVQVTPAQAAPGDTLQIAVRWQARGRPTADYTTLLHLGQPDEVPLATGDRPPLDGRYPTSAWDSGEQIVDHYELRLPPDIGAGRYPIWIGMYDPQTMERLPLLIAGQEQPFQVYLAGWVDVQ